MEPGVTQAKMQREDKTNGAGWRRRRLSRPLLLLLALGLVVVSMGLAAALLPSTGSAFAQDNKLTPDTKVIRIGSGPTGGTDFLFGGLVANAISNPPGSRECEKGGNCGVPGLIAVAQTTSGGVANLQAVAKGDVEMGLASADVATWAFQGKGAFAGQTPLSHLRVIARLYPSAIHVVVRADSKITSVTGLKGKRIGIGEQGSATAATARYVLGAYGVKASNARFRYLNFTAFAEALAAEKVDALVVIGGAPVLALEDLARRTPIRLIPLSGDQATKLTKQPFYTLAVVPAGTYGITQDIPTLAVGSVLVARDTMDETLAFGIARAIWHERNVALFQNGHPAGKLMDRKNAAYGVEVPIHAGAARFYLSQAISVPADSQPVLKAGSQGAKS
jgi:TRAP transporter TAXI family solute receptor